MEDNRRKKKKFSWHANINSGGSLDLSIFFNNKNLTKKEKEMCLADSLLKAKNVMLSKGYLTPNSQFMSSTDLANKYGKTRQYWEKLLNEGKIPYKETSAGRITTDIWVNGYLNNKEKVNNYIRKSNLAVKRIQSTNKRIGDIKCPNCENSRFRFAVNVHNINGCCDLCGFKLFTTR